MGQERNRIWSKVPYKRTANMKIPHPKNFIILITEIRIELIFKKFQVLTIKLVRTSKKPFCRDRLLNSDKSDR